MSGACRVRWTSFPCSARRSAAAYDPAGVRGARARRRRRRRAQAGGARRRRRLRRRDGQAGLHPLRERAAGRASSSISRRRPAARWKDSRECRGLSGILRVARTHLPEPAAAARHIVCTGPITYKGHAACPGRHRQPEGGARGPDRSRTPSCPAISPTSVEDWQRNQYYQTTRSSSTRSPTRCARSTRPSSMPASSLQIDDPHARDPLRRHARTSASRRCRDWAEVRIEALNHALRDIPREKVRWHTLLRHQHRAARPRPRAPGCRRSVRCRSTPARYSFEAANPRHEHEWRVSEDVKLPEGTILIPGAITHSSVLVEHPELVADRHRALRRAWSAARTSSPAPIAASAPSPAPTRSTRASSGRSSTRWWTGRGSRRSGCGAARPEPRHHGRVPRGRQSRRPRHNPSLDSPSAELQMTSFPAPTCSPAERPQDTPVTVKGWVRTRRDSKAGISFVHVSDGSSFHPVQVVAPSTLPNYAEEVQHLTAGCAVEATGTVVPSPAKGQPFEMQATAIKVSAGSRTRTPTRSSRSRTRSNSCARLRICGRGPT